MTLMQLTAHEAGIIVYADSTIVVANWGQYDDDMLPILGPFGLLIPWKHEAGYLDSAKCECVADLRTVLPGSIWLTDEVDDDGVTIANTDMDIVSDEFDDIPRLFLAADLDPCELEASVYTLGDGTKVIAPDTWN